MTRALGPYFRVNVTSMPWPAGDKCKAQHTSGTLRIVVTKLSFVCILLDKNNKLRYNMFYINYKNSLRDGIGRHPGFRNQCRKACRFKSGRRQFEVEITLILFLFRKE